MSAEEPFDRFKSDLQRARDARDATANVCTVANVDADGYPQARTLVLREFEDELAIFINRTSPKWEPLSQALTLVTYWPSIQVQYRISGTTRPIAHELVAESWQLRPDAPKKMDWFYTKVMPQSTPIGSREDLLAAVEALDLPDILVAPETAGGLIIEATRYERLDLTMENGIHKRQCWQLTDSGWQTTTLVP